MTDTTGTPISASEIFEAVTTALAQATDQLAGTGANRAMALALVNAHLDLAMVKYDLWTLQIDEGVVTANEGGQAMIAATVTVDGEAQVVSLAVPTPEQQAQVAQAQRWREGVQVVLHATAALARADLGTLEQVGRDVLADSALHDNVDAGQLALVKVDLDAVRAARAFVAEIERITRAWQQANK